METINFKDVTLNVYGKYYEAEGETYYYPGVRSSFDIEKITLDDSETDIWNLFTFDDLNKIVELVIDKIED